MTPDEQEARARSRFAAIQLTRIGGTVIVLLALVLWQTDRFVEGGSIIGFPIALIGLAISFLGPKQLARRWRTPPPGS